MNLTGTLPKGLLSPTNNSIKKHTHADYFQNTTTDLKLNKFENTTPLNFKSDSGMDISMRNEN